MLYQVIIAAGLVIFLINLILNLRSLKTPRRDARVPAQAPLISVMVPARDEEENIGNCVKSLLKQDYPNYEVLVLDDNSADRTAEIVEEIASGDNRVRLIRGKPLPEDWAGKPHACYQLARQAKGDWLLFVDADTTHAPHMLRSVLSIAIKHKVLMLSGFPRQLAASLPQKIVIPVMYFIILGWLPLWWLHRCKKPKPSMAIGQFLLFPRDEYWKMGGHKVVQSRIVEDVWLGIEVGRRGGRHIAIDLSPVVSCNMYRDIGTMWHGLGRSIYSITAMAPFALVMLLLAAYFFYIAPFYWLWNGFFVTEMPYLYRGIMVFQLAVILFMRWLIDRRFREPGVSVWFHPVGMLFYFMNVIFSGGRWIIGAGVTWKERFYGRESTVE